MVYNMTKNPKIYKKTFYLQSLKIYNHRVENQQISKIANVEKPRNIRKWRATGFCCEMSENGFYQYKSK